MPRELRERSASCCQHRSLVPRAASLDDSSQKNDFSIDECIAAFAAMARRTKSAESLERLRVKDCLAPRFGGDRFVDAARLCVYSLGIHSESMETPRASPPYRSSATNRPASLQSLALQKSRAKCSRSDCRRTRTAPDSDHQSSSFTLSARSRSRTRAPQSKPGPEAVGVGRDPRWITNDLVEPVTLPTPQLFE